MFRSLCAVSLAAMLAIVPTADAQYSQTLAEYSGTLFEEGPFPTYTIGTFTSIPAGPFASATISGTFGNSLSASSSGLKLYLEASTSERLQVAECISFGDCWFPPGPDFWSFTFSGDDFDILELGDLTLVAEQTGIGYVRLGETTLEITTTTVPEPASLALLGVGLLGLAVVARRSIAARPSTKSSHA